ncbi:MAG TPA: M20/M25/M40 family metallo-hydrolase [Bryobacteraceae bacterium]|nr:M20/M25/M40 family metallo-hydrolase [Bryobacteraceae bacterium]
MRLAPLFLTAALLFAQMPSRVATGYDSIQTSRLKADLTFLSSDALEGRRSLERGSEVAIQWIASEFAKAGLKPLSGDSYLQPVPLIEYQGDREKTTLSVQHGDKSESFSAPDATCNFPTETTVSGAVVFAGYGISAPELGYDDYAGIDVKGKIVLYFNHEPQENDANSIFNGKGNTRYTNNYAKVLNAQRHGAVAVLTTADPNHAGQGAGRGQGRQGGRGAQPGAAAPRRGAQQGRPRIPAEALADGGTAIPAFALSAKLAADLLSAGGKTPEALQTAIDSTPSPMSMELPNTRVELHAAVAERRQANSYNVAGLLEGSDPGLKAETIVFSGHFDHDGMTPDGIFHGADDNGSGTVGVVELARAFSMNPQKPKRSVLFIVFAAEERGLLGAYYYVSHPLRPLETTRAEINFDMIGRNEAVTGRGGTPASEISPDTSNELGLIGTHYSPDYRAAVERANKTVGLNLNYKWDLDSSQQVLFRSDQYPFLLHDIPAVWWFTGFHPDYHQYTDTVEKINFGKMTKILKLAYLTGFDFADAPTPPKLEPKAKARGSE